MTGTIIIVTLVTGFALYSFIVDFLIPRHEYKNKKKQEAKERSKVDQLFAEAPTGFLQNHFAGVESAVT